MFDGMRTKPLPAKLPTSAALIDVCVRLLLAIQRHRVRVTIRTGCRGDTNPLCITSGPIDAYGWDRRGSGLFVPELLPVSPKYTDLGSYHCDDGESGGV